MFFSSLSSWWHEGQRKTILSPSTSRGLTETKQVWAQTDRLHRKQQYTDPPARHKQHALQCGLIFIPVGIHFQTYIVVKGTASHGRDGRLRRRGSRSRSGVPPNPRATVGTEPPVAFRAVCLVRGMLAMMREGRKEWGGKKQNESGLYDWTVSYLNQSIKNTLPHFSTSCLAFKTNKVNFLKSITYMIHITSHTC